MDPITLILLALGLSADAFAVSVTDGICSRKVSIKNAFTISLTFGIFQALMPVIGYILGRTFSDFIVRYQHWIALILLTAIGINMISEAINERKQPTDACNIKNNIFTLKNLSIQGIATSIDALAAGVSFAVMRVNILTICLLIGIITFFCCMIGVYIGRKFGSLLESRARIIGGFMLILIGIRIFIEAQMKLGF